MKIFQEINSTYLENKANGSKKQVGCTAQEYKIFRNAIEKIEEGFISKIIYKYWFAKMRRIIN
jgi:hypothetical protein